MVSASAEGSIEGAGKARLQGRLICDFRNVQIQTRALDLLVRGSRQGSDLILRIRWASASPSGSRDYGGFVATVLRRALTLPVGEREVRLSARDSTGKGAYSSKTAFSLSCTADCTST